MTRSASSSRRRFPGLRPKTRQLYEGLVRLHVVPSLGDRTLAEITPPRVRTWRAGLLDAGVGPVTVAKAYRLLRTILGTAMPAGGDLALDYAVYGVVLLELSDTGGGLPAHVVEALSAGKPAQTEKLDGSGLGLLGVRRLLRQSGGDLDLSSPSGKPTWFITIPLAPTGDNLETENGR